MTDLLTTSGIYAITNTTNGKQYVGSAADLRERWRQHRSKLRWGKHGNPKLQRAFDKYGLEVFTFQVLEECPQAQLAEREQHWIDTLDCVRHGYNIRPCAESNRGWHLTLEQRARYSEIHTTRLTDPQQRAQAVECLRAVWTDPAIQERRIQAIKQTAANPEYQERQRTAQRERFNDPAERERHTARAKVASNRPAVRARHAEIMQARYSDPAERERTAQQMREYYSDPAKRERHGVRMREVLADPTLRTKLSERQRAAWADPEIRAKRLVGIREAAARRKAQQQD
jgi:group I intron endonuclease